MQSCMDMNWTWESILLVDFISTVLTNFPFCFFKSRMEKVSGVRDPKREKEVPSKGTKQKLLRSSFQSAPTRPAVILPLVMLIHFPAECSRTLNPGTGWGSGTERGLLLRIWGQQTSLRSNSRWWQNLFPIQNCKVCLAQVKVPDLTAGGGGTKLVFMCERKQGHAVKKARENRGVLKAMFVFPTLLRNVFNFRQMSLLEQD